MNQQPDETLSYRRGVILGFTIAEIVLLILFALLLALAALLLSGREQVQRANAINHKFQEALNSVDRKDRDEFIKKVTQALSEEVDYQKKLEDLEKKMRTQSLPDDVYAEIRSLRIDLSTKEGKDQFLDLLARSLSAREAAAKKLGLERSWESACQAGSELQRVAGPDADPRKLPSLLKDSRGREEFWKNQAAKCGLAGVLPPCYKGGNQDPTPFLYDARIKENGIFLYDTIPEVYRQRFLSDFKELPTIERGLTDAEFRAQTYKFLVFGQQNQCRFYVRIFDDLGENKQRLKEAMKAIESNFYKVNQW